MSNKMSCAYLVVDLSEDSWINLNPGDKDVYRIEWTQRYGGWVRAKKNTTTAWRIKPWEVKETALEEGHKVLL